MTDQTNIEVSDKRYVPAVLLCLFLGTLGVHRFYLGRPWTGILMILPLGGFGIWSLIDLVRIIVANMGDAQGRELAR